MGSWTMDRSEWPLVVYAVEGNLSNEELDAFVLDAGQDLARGERYAVVFDTTKLGAVSAYMRSRSIQWQRAHTQELAWHCVGTVYVLASPLLRFVAMTVLMVTRLPTPLKVCERVDEAKSWALERLQTSGGGSGP